MKDTTIYENWTAIDEVEAAAREKTGDPEAGFNPNLFFFGKGRHLVIPIKYRKKNRNGKFTEKYFELMVNAKYCPFTGKPLHEPEQEEDFDEEKQKAL